MEPHPCSVSVVGIGRLVLEYRLQLDRGGFNILLLPGTQNGGKKREAYAVSFSKFFSFHMLGRDTAIWHPVHLCALAVQSKARKSKGEAFILQYLSYSFTTSLLAEKDHLNTYTKQYIITANIPAPIPSKTECCFKNIVDKMIRTQSIKELNFIHFLLAKKEPFITAM